MRCPNCGAEVINDICDFCGSKMPEEKSNERKLSWRERFIEQISLMGSMTFLERL